MMSSNLAPIFLSFQQKNLIPVKPYRKRIHNCLFWSFSKIEAADVRSLLPINLNEAGDESLFGAILI